MEQYNKPASAALRGRIDTVRQKLLHLGIAADGPNRTLIFHPARSIAGAGVGLTVYEKAMLEHFHAVVLAELVAPGRSRSCFTPISSISG